MTKRRLATIVLSIVLAIGLMPAMAFAASGGTADVANQTTEHISLSNETANTPSKPSTRSIKCKSFSVYQREKVADKDYPTGYKQGDYAGEGLAITLEFTRGDYEIFTAFVSKVKKTPAKLTKYGPVVNEIVSGYAKAGEKYHTYTTDPETGAYINTLDPNTTYYVYVATGNINPPGYFEAGATWSEWSDPITIMTAGIETGLRDNPLTAKAKDVVFSASKVKKKKCSVKAAKAFEVKDAKGEVSYEVTKYVTKAAKGKVKVAANGKVTVMKGTPKKTYKLKVKITVAGNSSYQSASKTVKLVVKVK